jgi:hypothetical protein
MSLRFANGVVWVANAKQGGLTKADIEYLKTNVPAETPKLIALTHLDLMPPSQHSSVLSNAQSLAQTIPNVVGVVETTKGQSLAKSPMWGQFLSRSEKNKRLKPLVQEAVGILEEQQARLKEQTEKEVEELLSAWGLSEEQFSEYLMELLEISRKGIFQMSELVRNPHAVGYQMDAVGARKKLEQVAQTLEEKSNQTWDFVSKRRKRPLESASEDYAYLPDLILSCYRAGVWALFKCLNGVYQSAEALCSRFATWSEDGDAGTAFRESWPWGKITESVGNPFRQLYRDSVRSVKRALLANHKIRALYKDGQGLLESGQLDELG